MKAKGGLNLKLNTSSQVEISKNNKVSNLIIFLGYTIRPVFRYDIPSCSMDTYSGENAMDDFFEKIKR